jgi:diguanylate cyclase (GGDEF)-like protein/PAS domain S-box-containing protein
MPADDNIDRGRTRISRAAREAALNALLERNRDAWVAAMKPNGQFMNMPESVPLRGQRVLEGPTSPLDLVMTADRSVVIDTWDRLLTEGGANTSVHAFGEPSRVIDMHFVDMTDTYGVLIGLFHGYRGDAMPRAAERKMLAPRTSVLRKDQMGMILSVDDAATAILGWPAEEMIGRRSLDFIHPDDHERAVANWMELYGREGLSQRVRLRHRHRDGSWVWLEVTNHNHLDDPDDPCVLADNVDVTEEVMALEALRDHERLLRTLTEALPVGVLHVAGDGTVDYANERLAAIVGVEWASTVEEQFATAIGEHRDELLNSLATVLQRGTDIDLSASFLPKAYAEVHCDVKMRALINEADDVVGAIVCVIDVTQELKLREELKRRARYDMLTGCLNHESVMSALAERLAAGAAPGLTVALFIDLDEFKTINDRYGHAAGDHVLRQVADDLRRIAHDGDLVGRLGGDEFLLVSQTSDDPGALTAIANRVAEALDHRIAWENHSISPGASIGLSYAHVGSGISAERLVREADKAMYASKRSGRAPVFINAGSDLSPLNPQRY